MTPQRPAPNAPRPIAVSIGEPAGIGPEIIAKAWTALEGRVPFL